jgi:chromosome partitioning protein
MSETWLRSLKQKLTDIYVQKEAQEWVDLNLSTAGLLNITIVSDKFENLSTTQRREAVKNDIEQQHKFLGFISLYTIQEAASLDLKAPQLLDAKSIHTWQDLALWSANPQNQSPSSPELCLPRTVTFYSFKGGVGRTTALIHVAWILAMRGRKVVAVDLDLEAPGLSTAFPLNPLPEYGIVDYFYEKSYLPEGVEAKINITKIFGEVNIPDATGRLFIVPAGYLSLDYIAKVDDLRATTILDNGETLWSTFSREIQNQLKPDLILVDSCTGINEWGALSLLQAANEAIIFLFPNEQNQKGIELVLKSLTSFGRLSLNFVFSPVPDLSDTGITKVTHAWQIFQKDIDKNIDIDSEDYLIIPYIPSIAIADRYPVTGLLDYYAPIANLIDEDTNFQ